MGNTLVGGTLWNVSKELTILIKKIPQKSFIFESIQHESKLYNILPRYM